MVFVYGRLKAGVTGWVDAVLSGIPKPVSDAGISFCRPNDRLVQAMGTLAVDLRVWMLVSGTSSGYIGWSASYACE